jgi:hypothetical protein
VVFSCYYSTKDFYHGRASPNMKWILAFLQSAHEWRVSRAHGTPLVVVLFADPSTAGTLQKLFAAARVTWAHDVMTDDGFAGSSPLRTVNVTAFLTIVRVSNATHGTLLQRRYASAIGNGANNFRFALYRDWLRRAPRGSVGRVLMSDITDVVFQANPFDGCVPSHQQQQPRPIVVFTLEDQSRTFRNERYNKRWMECLGNDVVRNLGKAYAPISCAGVTLANSATAAELYTSAQLALISEPHIETCAIKTIGAALDQATHNFILHAKRDVITLEQQVRSSQQLSGLLARFEVMETSTATGLATTIRDEPVDFPSACTFHGNFVQRPRLSADGMVLDPAGRRFAIVHQYSSNRHPAIEQAVAKRYHLPDIERAPTERT